MPSLKEIGRTLVVTLCVSGILLVLGLIVDALDVGIPLWVGAGAVLAALLIGIGIGRILRAGGNLELIYAEHVREALETFQRALSDEIPDVTFGTFIDRGILGPARHWLTV